jgi:hypothetical protein
VAPIILCAPSTNKHIRPPRRQTSRASDQQSHCSMFRSYLNTQKHVSRAGREIRSIAVGLRRQQSHADRVLCEQWTKLVQHQITPSVIVPRRKHSAAKTHLNIGVTNQLCVNHRENFQKNTGFYTLRRSHSRNPSTGAAVKAHPYFRCTIMVSTYF